MKPETDEGWKLLATEYAFQTAISIIIQLFGHRAEGLQINAARVESSIETLRTQVKAAKQIFFHDVPERMQWKCSVPFQILENVLGVLETAHPEATLRDLTHELLTLGLLMQPKPPPPSERTA